MATHPVQRVTTAGAAVTYAAPEAGGDKFTYDEDAVMHVRNASAGPVTVTPNSIAGCDYTGTDHDTPPVTVAAGTEQFLGPWRPRQRWVDSSGFLNFSTSVQADIALAVMKVTP